MQPKQLSISEADSYLEMSLKAEKWAKYKNLKDLLKPFDRYRYRNHLIDII